MEGAVSGGAWDRALLDAAVDEERVRRIALAGAPDLERSRYGFHAPPGVPVSAGQHGITAEEAEMVNEEMDLHRVVHVTDLDEIPLLGLLRSELEHVRQWDAAQGVYRLTMHINGSLDELYGRRKGGAVVYLALPMLRDSIAAGGKLIRAVYGPQHGRYYDPHFGPMYRSQRDPGRLEDLPKRTVVFGAIHAEALDALARRQNSTVYDLIGRRIRLPVGGGMPC